MKQIGIKAYYLLFFYNFFFKHFVNGACAPKYTAVGTSTCYATVDECINAQYYYYDSYTLQCWKTNCPSGYYTNELNSLNLPSEDISRNTCVKKCSQNFPYLKGTTCKSKCDIGEAYTIDAPYACQSETTIINSNQYPYVSETDLKLYLKECHFEKFIIQKDGKNVCVSY